MGMINSPCREDRQIIVQQNDVETFHQHRATLDQEICLSCYRET